MSTAYRSVLDLCQERFNSNMRLFEQVHSLSKITPVLKAYAYGHGLEQLLHLMKGYPFKNFAVTSLEECLTVLNKTTFIPQILHGPSSASALLYDKQVEFVISLPDHIKWLSVHTDPKPGSYWLKVDLGLNRLGFSLSEARSLLKNYRHLWKGLFGHLGAIEKYPELSRHQAHTLKALAVEFDLPLSLENSEGLGAWHQDLVGSYLRLGLSFYGYSKGSFPQLKPLARLYTPLIKKFAASPKLMGYDWKNRSSKQVYLTPFGYGDGMSPHLAGAKIQNDRFKILAPVMMDLCYLEDQFSTSELNCSSHEIQYACWFGHSPEELFKLAEYLNVKPYVLLAQLTRRIYRTENFDCQKRLKSEPEIIHSMRKMPQ